MILEKIFKNKRSNSKVIAKRKVAAQKQKWIII